MTIPDSFIHEMNAYYRCFYTTKSHFIIPYDTRKEGKFLDGISANRKSEAFLPLPDSQPAWRTTGNLRLTKPGESLTPFTLVNGGTIFRVATIYAHRILHRPRCASPDRHHRGYRARRFGQRASPRTRPRPDEDDGTRDLPTEDASGSISPTWDIRRRQPSRSLPCHG